MGSAKVAQLPFCVYALDGQDHNNEKSMKPITRWIAATALSLTFATAQAEYQEDVAVYVNASVWSGEHDRLLENTALVVRDGVVAKVVAMSELDIPEGARTQDLGGRYVVPGLINAHGHVGVARGLATGPAAHSAENVEDQLRLYAHYGITTVVSLGDEPQQAFAVRNEQQPAADGQARLWMSGPVIDADSPAAARESVAQHLAANPDWIKIRVNDYLGRGEKMRPEVYRAVIDAAHDGGVPAAVHIVALDDTLDLLKSGADLVAHSVRDKPVSQEMIDLMRSEGICITPTLTREISVFVYAQRPDFFDDPFFLETADTAVLEELQQPEVQQGYTGREADFYRQALPLAKANMMALHNGGVRIAMGTDSGPPARFQGYFEHLEMEMMQEAGMTPLEVLVSATRNAAACMSLDGKVGTLAPGKAADFLVLSKNPLEDVRNLRAIEDVYIGGIRVERTATH